VGADRCPCSILRRASLALPFVVGSVLAGGAVAAVEGAVAAVEGAVVAVVGAVVAVEGTVVAVESAVVVTVVVVATAGVPEPVARLTSAAASTPSDSATTTASAAVRPLQLGDAARRVRAAAPQRRHHSWSGCNGAPHSGHGSPDGGDIACVPAVGGDVATLTSPTPAGG
jgi:hypothetical protein